VKLGALQTTLHFHPLDEVVAPAPGQPCRRCGRVVRMRARQLYCSAACKQADWRDRQVLTETEGMNK